MSVYALRPAQVKFIGQSKDYDGRVTTGKKYLAFLNEHWSGERCNLHIQDNSGQIRDRYMLPDFEVLFDVDHVLDYEMAAVKCVRIPEFPGFFALTLGNIYPALGIGHGSMKGKYLVMDNSGDDYFYLAELFEIVSDPGGILNYQTGFRVYDFDRMFALK